MPQPDPFMEKVEQHAVEEIVGHQLDLWRYCLALTGSRWDAEDLMQEAFLRALKGKTKHAQLKAQLFLIAKNAWIDECRKRKTSQRRLADESCEKQDSPDPVEIVEAMTVLLKNLSPLQRTVLLLCDVFECTSGEAAEMLRTTSGAVKAALHRARKALMDVREQSYPALASPVDSDKELLSAYLTAFRETDMQAFVVFAQNGVIQPIQALTTVLTKEINSLKSTNVSPISQGGWKNLLVA